MEKKKSVTIQVSKKNISKLKSFYEYNIIEKTPPYAVFQAVLEGVNVTLYQSGKCLFQGNHAENEASFWISDKSNVELAKKEKTKEKVKENSFTVNYDNYNVVGSDEVGTGDYFGPIVVVGAYVPTDKVEKLRDLGIKDSKKITDTLIVKIAPEIIRLIDSNIFILSNEEYNRNKDYNMNHMKAILHNKVLIELENKHKNDLDYILIDQFAEPRLYFNYLSDTVKPSGKLNFETKAESKSIAVAAASVIARYVFLQQMKKMSDEVGVEIPLGAGTKVDIVGEELYMKHGKDIFNKIAKLNFKNTSRIMNEIK